MKIAVIGATGFVGKSIVNELVSRHHEVIAIARKLDGVNLNASVKWVKADVNDAEELATILKGSDAVVSAFNAGWSNPDLYNDFLKGAGLIQDAVKKSGVKRFIFIGGAGSLFVAPGVQAVDTPDFPKEFHAGATAARDYLMVLSKEKDLDWVYFSPAFEMHHGISTGRTGKYRTGLDHPVFNENHRSILSVEDVAVAIVDELEHPKFHQVRFTAAY